MADGDVDCRVPPFAVHQTLLIESARPVPSNQSVIRHELRSSSMASVMTVLDKIRPDELSD